MREYDYQDIVESISKAAEQRINNLFPTKEQVLIKNPGYLGTVYSSLTKHSKIGDSYITNELYDFLKSIKSTIFSKEYTLHPRVLFRDHDKHSDDIVAALQRKDIYENVYRYALLYHLEKKLHSFELPKLFDLEITCMIETQKEIERKNYQEALALSSSPTDWEDVLTRAMLGSLAGMGAAIVYFANKESPDPEKNEAAVQKAATTYAYSAAFSLVCLFGINSIDKIFRKEKSVFMKEFSAISYPKHLDQSVDIAHQTNMDHANKSIAPKRKTA